MLAGHGTLFWCIRLWILTCWYNALNWAETTFVFFSTVRKRKMLPKPLKIQLPNSHYSENLFKLTQASELMSAFLKFKFCTFNFFLPFHKFVYIWLLKHLSWLCCSYLEFHSTVMIFKWSCQNLWQTQEKIMPIVPSQLLEGYSTHWQMVMKIIQSSVQQLSFWQGKQIFVSSL